jgi:DNA-binding response OmpR family regulator
VGSAKGRILVVDDQPAYASGLRELLEIYSYCVIVAQDGRKAVELAASHKPDLILLDVELPGIDGYEACRRIRQFSTVPIIMLSALFGDIEMVRGLQAGADECVTKFIGVDELLTRIEESVTN